MPRVSINASATGWSLNGNTVTAEKYIGTNDNFDFPIYTNALRAVTIDVNQNTGFGIAAPTARTHVKDAFNTSATFTSKWQNSSNLVSLQIRSDGSLLNYGKGAIATNTAFGNLVLLANTTGYDNTAFGSATLKTNTTGYSNTVMGINAMTLNTTGSANTAIGQQSLASNTTGSNNVALGYDCMFSNTTGTINTAVGFHSLYSNVTGEENVAVGYYSQALGTSYYNTSIGTLSGYANTGQRSVFLGFYAGRWSTTDDQVLYIDNRDRANNAAEKTDALIYGVFNISTAAQKLYFNAATISMRYIPIGNAGLASGDTYVDTAANALLNGDLILIRKT